MKVLGVASSIKATAFCDYCENIIDNNESIKMQGDELSDDDNVFNITEKTCMGCRKTIRADRAEMSGDYSPLHPDETAADFEGHEDHDPN